MAQTAKAQTSTMIRGGAIRALALPSGLGLLLVAYALMPAVRMHDVLLPTLVGAGAVLLAWSFGLYVSARRTGRTLLVERMIRTPHWVQTCAQGTLLLYWGWHVRSVYAHLPLLMAQLVFAYGLDCLLQLTRRGRYQVGFGPVPVIFSVNFFLWFRPDWYYWQFALVALVYVGKEFLRWTRDGRTTHIFNPSAFALGVFSAVLILTGTSQVTLGLEIAQTLFNPPFIYVVLFMVSLPAQILYGVAAMTVPAVVTVVGWGLVYFAATGTYYFRDAFIPAPVFLGMLLLFTDPATSPRTGPGRVLFGVLYAVMILALTAILEAFGAPTFFDKLIPIPILNLAVRRLDRIGAAVLERVPRIAWPPAPAATRQRLAVVGTWVLLFGGLSFGGILDDHHPGQYLPFWERACATGNERACEYTVLMKTNYCARGSGWACNELAIQRGREGDRVGAFRAVTRSCDLGFAPGCENALRLGEASAAQLASGAPGIGDLQVMVRGSKGPLMGVSTATLLMLACERGWQDVCVGTTVGSLP